MSTLRGGKWSNWSGSVQGTPRQFVQPGSMGELTQRIATYARDGRRVRVVGSGHSFTPLVQTDDVLISLDCMQGVEEIDADRGAVTVLGGTKLKRLGEELLAQRLAQENLGDINVQSIAGAVSTGTHGTGTGFGSLSTQLEAITLVTASGEALECSTEQNPDVFKAAQVSIGMLGIIARVKLRVVPARVMHYRGLRMELDDVLANLEQYKRENSHFEFFWFPYTRWVQAKFLNETNRPPDKSTFWSDFNKIVMENWVYGLLSEAVRLFPKLSQSACKISASSIANINETNYSHRLLSTPRSVRFQEMEYNIPAEHTVAVIHEIQECIERHRFEVHFPLECRFVHSDDIWLSPAYQRESAYLAVHMYRGMPYQEYFDHVEEIFKHYQGRPHWGKMHTRTAIDLAGLYPRWQDFRRVHAALDPTGMFLNDYLRSLVDADGPIEPVASAPAVEVDE